MLHEVVHAAKVSDRKGAEMVLAGMSSRLPSVRQIWVDAGYAGGLIARTPQALGVTLAVVKRPRRWGWVPADQRAAPAPIRVPGAAATVGGERTFAWLGRYRRLSKDDEQLPATETAWINAAMVEVTVQRLTR